MPRALWLCCVLCFACEAAPAIEDASVGADAAAVDPDAGLPPEDLDGFITWQMERGGLPGAAVAIVRPDGDAFVGAYGYADLEGEVPVDRHTLFILASVSKTVAAVRVMQLVESGALDLDAPLDGVLPYALRHPEHPDAPITARMLLAHVSGLEDVFSTLAEVTTAGGDPEVSLAEFAEGYASEGGAWYGEGNWGAEPGTRHAYCNAGYGVIGHLVEVAGGASFRAQTEDGIFGPLAMDGAGWFLADVDEARVAVPYGYNGRSYNPLPQNGFAYYPASSLRASITGLARYARMLLRGGELDGSRVLSEESVAELLRLQYPELDRGQALTFSERGVGASRYIGHSGSTFGGSTQFLLSREGTHAIVLITNSDAYIRSRFGQTEGRDAMEAILRRLDAEAR
ncbi:MAG: class A beta-lactamase-related serine hydrolase [Sandaracinaceae bacterium]|nr:MAG: class A beta-lactamase-related serine hydrolase [Sandaracinaceae bacterium]